MPDNAPKRILVVDDTLEIVTFYQAVLERKGFQVDMTLRGQDCLDYLEHTVPDLIILDLAMPDMDGLTVCEKIRVNERTKRIPILAITAFNDAVHREQLLKRGANATMGKPIDIYDLIDRVKTMSSSTV